MSKTLYISLLTMILSVGYNTIYASHIAGGELSYTWLSDSTYQLTFKFYRDCSGISQPTMVTVCYKSDCDSNTYNVTLVPTITITGGLPNGSPVNSSCPNYPTTCNGGMLPGYAEWWYIATVTLPSRCSRWVFSTIMSARNPDDNLQNSTLDYFYVETTLNNILAPTNNSVNFTVNPVPFVCDNQPFIYNNGSVDIDNDSLGYEVIQPKTSSYCGAPMTDIPFVSSVYNLYNNPMSCNNTFVLDTLTGELHFTPNLIGSYTFALRVTEYRNQVPIASTMRDMQVHVLSCNAAAPTIQLDTTTVTLVNNKIQDCSGVPLHFCFSAKSANPAAVLVATDNHDLSAPGSSITYRGLYTDSIYGCVSWLPNDSDAGLKVFTVSVADSNCAAPGIIVPNTYSVPIYILNGVTISADTSICYGASTALSAVGSASYAWSVLPGGAPLSSLSCTTCSNPVASPGVTTTYTITTQGGSCAGTDTVVVIVVPIPATPMPTSNNPVCEYDSILLFAGISAPSYSWSGPAGFSDTVQNPVIYITGAASDGMYYVSAVDRNCYSMQDSVYVHVLDAPVPSAITVSGINILSTDDTFSSYQWYLNDSIIVGANADTLIAFQPGYYTVQVTNETGCSGFATIWYIPEGVGNLNLAAHVNMYPNPATTSVSIDAPIPVDIEISDMAGMQLLHLKKAKQADISRLAAGVYLVKITDTNGQLLKVEKLLKFGN